MATILNAAENTTWWPTLSAGQQNLYRDQVKSAIAVFYDLTRDVVKVSEEDATPRNDVVLDAIRAMHSEQRQISARLKGTP
jgi:hypothetical protein